MFIDLLKMDLKRSLDMRKVIPVVLLIVFFMIFGEDEFQNYPETLLPWSGYSKDYDEILCYLSRLLLFDTYKVVFVILLCSLYSACFCKDNSNGYIRMVLSRTDVKRYTQSKFIANTISIILVSLCSFFLYVLVLLPNRILISSGDIGDYHYIDVMRAHPICYIVMAGLQFGMITAACSSIGMLVSTFQPDAFVSIGLPGLVFFMALSYTIYDWPLNMVNMVGMERTLTLITGGPNWLDYLWGITFPLLVICLIGFLFYLRLTQRMKEGEV